MELNRQTPPRPARAGQGKGLVRAIYAVTGVVDEVQDLILPGAFGRTLATRRVKPVWHHEWKDPVGSVLDVEEWRPGDPRFSTVPGGAVWPKEAGALVATVQYNLRTTRGRDTYEQVRQWHNNNEAQFSIGYKVTAGGASKRHDGVRIIHDLDLYEISPVLHGAHPMTRSLEVKATGNTAESELERKATWSAVELKAAEPQAGRGVMIALQVPAEAAAQIEQPEGTAAELLHITLAYLGDAADLGGEPEELRGAITGAVAGHGPLRGTLGGIGRFPDTGSGEPTWVPVDVPGLVELRQQVVEALKDSRFAGMIRSDHGFTPHVTLGYDLPDVPPVPSTPVAFDRVAVVVGSSTSFVGLTEQAPAAGSPAMTESKSASQVVLEAKAAGGADRNQGGAEHLRRWYASGEGAARIGWGASGDFDRCVAIASEHMSPDEAKGYCNLRHHDAMGIYPATHAAELKSAAAIVLEAKAVPQFQEGPMHTPLPISYEQLQARLGEAVRALLAPDTESCHVAIEATYPDRVIASHSARDQTATYAIPYTAAGRDIDLGTPSPVELTTVAMPVTGISHAVDGDEAIDARFMQPTANALGSAADLIEVSGAAPAHLERLRPTITRLLATLAKKGLPMDDTTRPAPPGSSLDLWDSDYEVTDGWDDDEPGTSEEDEPEGASAPTTVPPGNSAPVSPPAPAAEEDQDDEPVRLDADEVKAALASLAV
ncbi:2'-5' RNA ligase family protein [Streptomyces sp. NPDC002812]|uniref:2'-5' RNA ligase family protein n=1 Tax=Streptomyces sp. NPDC002812 TaxID=3154434 RepID=UPI0033248C9D